ncbi:MAG: major capsid protein [Bacteroidales bacterium]|nr:major capsid protein [Bacteroidales bacterium]
MRTNVKSYYDLLDFGLGGASFQQFVDRFKQKYNAPQTDGFQWDDEIQLDFTYEQLEADLGVATLPVYTDIDSPGLYKSFESFKIGSNKIPPQKHGFALNQKILREKMILAQKYGEAALTNETRDALLSLQFDSVDKLLAGNYNGLTHQRMRIVSTGQFTIDATNNPQGIKGITFDFGVPGGNKETLSGTARWWTDAEHTTEGATADPIKYLKDKYKWAKKNGYPMGHFEMSQDLFDDMLGHSKVLTRIGRMMFPNAGSDALSYAQNLSDDAIAAAITRLVGCPIIPRDSKAMVDKYDPSTKSLKKDWVENFNPLNVAYVPDGQIGTIKAAQHVLTGDPTVRTAFFDGGRTLITQRFESQTKSVYIESEIYALCVPQVARYMCIYTVTA